MTSRLFYRGGLAGTGPVRNGEQKPVCDLPASMISNLYLMSANVPWQNEAFFHRFFLVVTNAIIDAGTSAQHVC